MKLDYSQLPEHMQSGAQLYVEKGIKPGRFLMAVLSNDLKEAFGQADLVNRALLFEWASWLYNNCPHEAQGSPEKVQAWLAKGGLEGLGEDGGS